MVEKTAGEKRPPKQSNTLQIVGFILTTGWLVLLAIYFALNNLEFDGLKPNEFGDFLAGVFAPLAFLWLVLGFFQQGKELRHSGEALWLQGVELRNSVEQQRELVNVTREQLRFESEMLIRQQEELQRTSRPILRITQMGADTISSKGSYEILRFHLELLNMGRPCTDVRITVVDTADRFEHPTLATGHSVPFGFVIRSDNDAPVSILVEYIDERLAPGRATFLGANVAGVYEFEVSPRGLGQSDLSHP